MRATDIIRNVLDMIDAINRRPQVAIAVTTEEPSNTDDAERRFDQVSDLQTKKIGRAHV